MSKYVTFYAVEPDIAEIESIYMTWKVGECPDGTVYLCLDREDEAAESVTSCTLCFASLDDFFAAYPDLDSQYDTGEVDEDGQPIMDDIISRMSVC